MCEGGLTIERHEELKNLRLRVNLSQQYVAEAFKFSKSYISKIESGKKKCSDELYKSLTDYYRLFNYSDDLEALFDWVRIRIPTHNVKMVIEDIMGLDFESFYEQEGGRYGYIVRYELGSMTVYNSSQGSNKGVLIDLSGQGCRNFEYMLNELDMTWHDFFSRCLLFDGVPRRIDLAINDYKEYFTLDEVIEKVERQEIITKFKSSEVVKGNNIKEDLSKGKTLYLGSKSSLLYFCFYQKNYEQAYRLKIPVDEVDIKNRYELRFMDTKAIKIVEAFMEGHSILKIAKDVIAKQVDFICRKRNGDVYVWDKWTKFLGVVDYIDLSMKTEKPSFERKLRYLHTHCSQILKMIETVGNERGVDYLKDVTTDVELNEKNQKIMEQELMESYEFISQKGFVNKFTGEMKGLDDLVVVLDD